MEKQNEDHKRTMVNIRKLAVQALLSINRQGAYANITLQESMKQHHLNDLDRRFFTELVYGVMRRKNYLDGIIEYFAKKKINRLSPLVVEIIRLGLYQLIYLDKVPHSAAVNESVKLAKKMAKGGIDRFVNAILRNYLRRTEEVSIEALAKSESEKISYLYNQPLWLVEHWIFTYGIDETVKLCLYFNQKPVLSARFNPLRTNKETLISSLEDRGWKISADGKFPESFQILQHHGKLEDYELVKKGHLVFMDEASMAVAHVVNPNKGDRILDCCAAPGGKSLHMANLMENHGEIIACDIHEHKLKLIENTGKTLGISVIKTKLQDGRTLNPKEMGFFDKVLVDAPCSGLGVLQKKLDMRWRKEPEQLQELPKLQLQILNSAATCVKEGGILVYSTCTLNDKENEEIIYKFLENNRSFTLENATTYLDFIETEGPMVTLLPHLHNTDGFFIARMRKEVL